MKNSILLVLLSLLIACQGEKESQKTTTPSFLFNKAPEGSDAKTVQTEVDSILDVNRYIVSTQPSQEVRTVIDESCGIILPIDTMKLDQLKGESASELEEFYVEADDMTNQSYQAGEYLKKMDMKTVHPKTRYLQFTVSGKTIVLDTRPDHASGWGYAMLYKKGKMPKLVDLIDTPFAYEDFYKD